MVTATDANEAGGFLKNNFWKTEKQLQKEIDKLKPKKLILFREGLEGVERATQKLINSIYKKRTVQIAKEGTDDYLYLEWIQAEANVGGEKLTHILVKEQPSKAALLEEFLHGTQHKIGIIKGSEDIAYAEFHVKDFMIRHKKLLG